MVEKEAESIVVIVVEDEAIIRKVIAEAFVGEGFDVLSAIHAQDAIAILEFEATRVHVLFTDIHMPGDMDGIMLAHHARLHWPWISLLITSGRGYPKTAQMPDGARFISKPYEVDHVVRHIREMAKPA